MTPREARNFALAAPSPPLHFNTMNDATNLTGKLLLAMPNMGDHRFDGSVIFLCMHSAEEGAMGLVINKPATDASFADLLKQLDIPVGANLPPELYLGGPVETGRGFVLHSGEYSGENGTLQVNDDFAMTATKSILKDIASGSGPDKTLTSLGYSGWGPEQLEGELQQNAWLICDASYEIVFTTKDANKWKAGLKTLGISPLMLSAEGGRA